MQSHPAPAGPGHPRATATSPLWASAYFQEQEAVLESQAALEVEPGSDDEGVLSDGSLTGKAEQLSAKVSEAWLQKESGTS